MPNASDPNAPCVEVWESPQTIVMPGCVVPLLRADDVDDTLSAGIDIVERHAEIGAVSDGEPRLAVGLSDRGMTSLRVSSVGRL